MDITTLHKGNSVWNLNGPKLQQIVEKSGVLQFAVIYHDHCMDGAFAMTLMAIMLEAKFRPESVKLIPMSYGKALEENIIGQHVILVDFSFSIPELAQFCKAATSVTVIDHHITATDSISKWQDKPDNFYYYLSIDPKNETDSGASLVYNFWYTELHEAGTILGNGDKQHVPKLIELLRTHDLWLHDGDVKSPALHLNYWFSGNPRGSLKSHYMVDELKPLFWNAAMLNNCIRYGEDRLASEVEYLRKEIQAGAKEIVVDGKLAWIIQCEKRHNSMMATLLNEDTRTSFSITYLIRPDGKYEYSLRSTRAVDYNVGELAKQLGGGGHRRAAGFVSVMGPDEVFKMLDMADCDPLLPDNRVKVTIVYMFEQLSHLLNTFDFTLIRERTTQFSLETPMFDVHIQRETCLQNDKELAYFTGHLVEFVKQLQRGGVDPTDFDLNEHVTSTVKLVGFPTVVKLDIKLDRKMNSVKVSYRDHGKNRPVSSLIFPHQLRK